MFLKCPDCGGSLIYTSSGGCGGRGTEKKCEKCGATFRQTTGGILPTPGGEKWEKYSGGKFETLTAPEAVPGELLKELKRATRARSRKGAKRGRRKR